MAATAQPPPAAGTARRFNFSPKVTPFQPSPSLTATTDCSYGTGTNATTTPALSSRPSDSVSPGCPPWRTPTQSTPGQCFNAAAQPFFPKALQLPRRAEEVPGAAARSPGPAAKGRIDVATLLSLRGDAAAVALRRDTPFAVASRADGWAARAAAQLQKAYPPPEPAAQPAKPAQAMTALAFLRSADRGRGCTKEHIAAEGEAHDAGLEGFSIRTTPEAGVCA